MLNTLRQFRRRRRQRALEALWAGDTRASADLGRALRDSPGTRADARQLQDFESVLANVVAQVAEERGVTMGRQPSPHIFDRAIRLATTPRTTTQSSGQLLLTGAMLASLVFGIVVLQPTQRDNTDHVFTARGTTELDHVATSALCLDPEPPHTPRSAERGQRLSCAVNEGIQLTLQDTQAAGGHVAAFALAPAPGGGGALIPFAPNPARPAPALAPHGDVQPVGAPTRLAVNHRVGAAWIVLVGTETPISWETLDATRDVWPDLTFTPADANAETIGQHFVRYLRFATHHEPRFVSVRYLTITAPER